MIREALEKAQLKVHLAEAEAYATFREIMNGEVTDPVLIGALLTAVQMNGPDAAEVTGAVRAMREAGIKVRAPEDAVDIVGTGGDGFGTFNCSTTAAFVAAGAGVTIAKHGNKASTSRSGSADCLAALGYDLLAPLTNPAGVRRHALGVYAPEVMPIYIGALRALGAKRALVFCGPDGLDELGLAGPSHVAELAADGSVKEYDVDPQALFGATYPVDALRGGAPAENARIAHDVLAGVEKGPYRLAAALNGAAAIVAGGKAETLDAALELAFRAIDSGAALGKLETLVAASRQR